MNKEKHIIRILVGTVLVSILSSIDREQIIEKSKGLGGLYSNIDIVLFAGTIIGIGVSLYLLIPSLIYLSRNFKSRQ